MMHNWNVRGLLLEGISGSGKTAVLKELNSSQRFAGREFHSALVLSEHQTQRVLELKERREGLEKEDNLSLLEQHIQYLERLSGRLNNMQWCEGGRINMRLPFLLERYHLTHVCHYVHMEWDDVRNTDIRLAALDCRLCLFTINREQMRERIINRRNATWQQYIKRYGNTEEDIIEYYAQQQQEFLRLCEASEMPVKVFDTSKAPACDIAQKVLDFWDID